MRGALADTGTEAGTTRAPFRPPDPLFDWPLPVPEAFAYRDLDIEPFATQDEVRWAKGRAIRRLHAEQAAVERELDAVYRAIPGLREAYRAVQAMQKGGSDRGDERGAHAELAELEGHALRSDPDFRRKRRRLAEIEETVKRINRQALDTPEERRAYDEAHPPLALLRLVEEERGGFVEPRTAFLLLRREVARFLSAQGEDVFHPSDLTREDFSADFDFNELLDGGADE